MRRVAGALVVLLAAVAAMLFANAARLRPVPRGGPPVEPTGVDAGVAAAHLAAAVRFRTVSHQDPAQDDATQFTGLRKFLARTYPKTHAALLREEIGSHGLLYTWTGRDPSARPVL